MRDLGATALGLLLAGCPGPPPVRVAGLTVDLVTPAPVDPLAGVDTLVIRVLDVDGNEVARSEGAPDAGVPLPLVTVFGELEVEVLGVGAGNVLSAARTGPIQIDPESELTVDALFLPVNRAVQLTWTPTTHRVGHATFVADDGRVLLLGGRVPSTNDIRTDSEWWHVRLGFDGPGPNLPVGVANAASSVLPDGTMLLAAGEALTGDSNQVTAITDGGAAARALPPLPGSRPDACVAPHPTLGGVVFTDSDIAVYNADGQVGVDTDVGISGVDACGTSAGRVVFAGDTGTGWGVLNVDGATWPVDFSAVWTPFDEVPSLVGPQLVVLADGDVWVGGGYGFSASTATRRLDPATASARRGPELAVARVHGTGARWRDGAVVLAGGYADEIRGTPVRSVEIFDPDGGSLRTIAVPVRGPSVSVLAGGAVLLTGGLDAQLDPAGAWAIVPYVGAGP